MIIHFQCIINLVFRKHKALFIRLLIILFKIKRVCEHIIFNRHRSYCSPQLNGVLWKDFIIVKKSNN